MQLQSTEQIKITNRKETVLDDRNNGEDVVAQNGIFHHALLL